MKANLDKQIDIRGLRLIGRVSRNRDFRIEEHRTYTIIIKTQSDSILPVRQKNKDQAENEPENDQAHAYPSPNLGLLG